MRDPIILGKTQLRRGLILAPMAGYTDRSMRRICHELGCELTVSEMISARAVTFRDKKTFALAKITEAEGPTALQLFGKEPEIMAEAARILYFEAPSNGSELPVAFDINMGCPVQKIFGNGEGSALMRDPELIYKITRAVKEATPLPVTVKIRTGLDEKHINAVECALAAETGGASLITVHGRTKAQMYSGTVDRETIKNVKRSVHIPVIANGDVDSVTSAIYMLKYTNADGIAIGRAAVGNPFLFSSIIEYLETGKYKEPSIKEKIETALRQLRLAIEDKGEAVAVRESRKQAALYLQGFPGAAALRKEINEAVLYRDVEEILRKAF